jgi:hypothetical protein
VLHYSPQCAIALTTGASHCARPRPNALASRTDASTATPSTPTQRAPADDVERLAAREDGDSLEDADFACTCLTQHCQQPDEFKSVAHHHLVNVAHELADSTQ